MTGIPDKIVLDASVLVAWVSKEKESEAALKLMVEFLENGTEFFAPTLLWYELINVLHRSKGLKLQKIRTVLSIVASLNIRPLELDVKIQELSMGLMVRERLSFYDASYAGIALMLNIPLFTLDEKLKKLKSVKIV